MDKFYVETNNKYFVFKKLLISSVDRGCISTTKKFS